ncbi:MAG: hypothetical protein ACNA8W_01705 [Bradymonadaceae bacterium]
MTSLQRVAVLADVSGSEQAGQAWADFDLRRVRSDDELEDELERLLSADPSVVVVDGDDRFLSRILTAYLGEVRHRSRPLRLLALSDERLTTVAEATSGNLDRKAARRYLSTLDAERWHTSSLPTLRITSSAEPAARYGFSFGVGWWYSAFEAYYRSGRADGAWVGKAAMRFARDSLADHRWAVEEPGRLTIDGLPHTRSWAHLMATTLSKSWFGLEGAGRGEPALWLGERSGELVRQLMSSRAAALLSDWSWSAVDFDRVHLDGLPGYVLDGELHTARHPQVIQVCRGPRVYFMQPETRWIGRVGNLLSRSSHRD